MAPVKTAEVHIAVQAWGQASGSDLLSQAAGPLTLGICAVVCSFVMGMEIEPTSQGQCGYSAG